MNYVTMGYETPLTLLIFFVGLMVTIYAQIKINNTYKIFKTIKSKKKLSGSEIARMILDENGLSDIYVVEIKGELSDHYDPSRKVIRLSHEVFHNDSIASISVAAHECGHAIQDKLRYTPMQIRSFLVPIVNFVTYIGYFVAVISLFAGITGYLLVGIGIILATLLFQLVTLPVEFDASKRAKEQLLKLSIVDNKEADDVKKMLDAAALTYVASFISTIINLLRLVLMYNDRRDN